MFTARYGRYIPVCQVCSRRADPLQRSTPKLRIRKSSNKRRDSASFSRWKSQRHLVPAQEDEASPRSRAGRRTVPPDSGQSAYRYPVGVQIETENLD
ncbi:hypothetical protein GW17_00003329 [Ensete ventricosum]|nr:hypothetical protein GW17_00003329 [Ensete ventricosum]